MPNNYMSLTFETDMSRGISPVTIKAALVYDDNLAHNVRIKCMEKGRFQSMSGTVQAYFIRADNSTVPMNGQIVDGVPEVKLLPECYNIAGRFLFLVKITNSGSTNTIFYGTGNVLRGRTDVVIDPGEVVPSLDELLAKINELELATNASFEATERANSAAETANTAAAAADEVRQDIQSGLAGKAPAIFVTASGDLVHITDGAAMPVKSLITHIEPVQSGSGDPSPTNVRPISGWTGAKLTRTGKNLLPKLDAGTYPNNGITFGVAEDGIIHVTGANANGAIFFYGPAAWEFSLPAGTYIFGSVDSAAHGKFYLQMLEKDSLREITTSTGNNPVNQFTIEKSTIVKVRFFMQATSESIDCFVRPMICVAGTDEEYKPHQSNQFTAPFGQTIYGGEFDWKTGKVTRKWHKLVFDGVTTGLRISAAANVRQVYLYDVDMAIKPKHDGTVIYNKRTETATVASNGSIVFSLPDSVTGVTENDTTAQVVEKYNALLAAWYAADTPLEIAYEIETPIEIQLTPQQILSLAGENNLWSDTGETEVTYAADTKMYIDQKIAAIAAAVLNN